MGFVDLILNSVGKKDRALGVAEGKRRYDLPLNKSPGNNFLVLLIALMTFLGMLALCASFALGAITERWSSGLQNQLTIEVPAETENGNVRSSNEINDINDDIKALLQDFDFVKTVEILDDEAVQNLISPWLGENFAMDDVPLPGLIALELSDHDDAALDNLKQALLDIDPTIMLDTHEDWLKSILELTGSLGFMAMIVTLVIAFTGMTAIAGAIRSRMAEHRPDVELLHLMGASDRYISKQFQRHAMILGLQGGFAGLICGGLMLGLFSLIAGGNGNGLLPDFSLSGLQVFILFLLPGFTCALAALTARHTVLQELTRMP